MKPRPRRDPRPVGALVERVLGDLGLGEAAGIVKVAERWEAAVGAEIARHCRPSALRSKWAKPNPTRELSQSDRS